MVTVVPDEAILRTLLYADIFDYPLTLSEIHYFLIATPATAEAVQAALENSPWLTSHVARASGYLSVRTGGESARQLAALRDDRRRTSASLWPAARFWGAVIGALPFVRMVAVTGALAVDNAPAGDDIDYLIVTAPGRVWLARALAVGVVRLARPFGSGLCPNYVLSQTALPQQRRDLFSAHDLAQMVPLVGLAVYADMRAANGWAAEYLPQADRPLHVEPELAPRAWRAWLKRAGEWLMGGRLGAALEHWEQSRKLRKFAGVAYQSGSAAELDADRIKGHFEDHGHPILRRFDERVAEYLRPDDHALGSRQLDEAARQDQPAMQDQAAD